MVRGRVVWGSPRIRRSLSVPVGEFILHPGSGAAGEPRQARRIGGGGASSPRTFLPTGVARRGQVGRGRKRTT